MLHCRWAEASGGDDEDLTYRPIREMIGRFMPSLP